MENSQEEMRGKVLTVPDGTAYFEFNGGQRTYQDLSIISQAEATVINKASFASSGAIPLRIESPFVILNQVRADAAGIGLVLSAEHTTLGLQGTVTIHSDNANAMVSKNLKLLEANENVAGALVVLDNIFICGEVDNNGKSLLKYTGYEQIDEETFRNMISTYTLFFDAKGGTCDELFRTVANSTALGTLPIPTCFDNEFEGWYLEDGTQVTADTVFSSGQNITLYAHWKYDMIIFDANGGDDVAPVRLRRNYFGGYYTLPKPKRTGYGFDGWYFEDGTHVPISSRSDTWISVTKINNIEYYIFEPNKYAKQFALGQNIILHAQWSELN